MGRVRLSGPFIRTAMALTSMVWMTDKSKEWSTARKNSKRGKLHAVLTVALQSLKFPSFFSYHRPKVVQLHKSQRYFNSWIIWGRGVSSLSRLRLKIWTDASSESQRLIKWFGKSCCIFELSLHSNWAILNSLPTTIFPPWSQKLHFPTY